MPAVEAIRAAQPMNDDAAPSASEARLQRNLKIVVVVLALLMFAGLATIVGRIIYLASTRPAQPLAGVNLPPRPEQSLQLPAGAAIRSVSLSGNRLAVHYEAGGAEGITVLDLETGKPITSVKIDRRAPD